MRFKAFGLAVLIGLLSMSMPASAHHATQAEFDVYNVGVITGTLTKILWVNPHVQFILEVTDPKTGEKSNWTMTHAGPGALRAAGLSSRDFFKVGEIYTMSFGHARNGSPRGMLFTIKTPEGRYVYMTYGDVGNDPLGRDKTGDTPGGKVIEGISVNQ